MAISNKLNFTRAQLRAFARTFRAARIQIGLTQLQVARGAFEYRVSHSKVSRIERCDMRKVDAHCLELLAGVVGVSRRTLMAIDPKFNSKAAVARLATEHGFWAY